jgi:hypothetical protein
VFRLRNQALLLRHPESVHVLGHKPEAIQREVKPG